MTKHAEHESNILSGRTVKRREDPKLITGAGQYLEDMPIENLGYVALLRSPHPYANIRSIDIEAARQSPGVLDIFSSADLKDVGGVPVDGDFNIPEHPPLATDTVRFVGEPVVAIIAETQYEAEDALDLITVAYEILSNVTDPIKALDEDAPLVHPQFNSNVIRKTEQDSGNVDEAFANAEHTLPVHVGHHRVAALPIENRGGVAAYDPDSDHYTLWLSTQAAWLARDDIARALGVPEEKVRVITPDVGGAFGTKMNTYREDILLLAIARKLGRPVRWIASRSEDLQSSMHGREAFTDGYVAFDSEGRIKGLRLRTIANLGAYLMKFAAGPPMRMMLFPTGAYTIPALHSEVVTVFTNTGPVGPYRGAGRPEAAFFIERVMSEVAHFLGLDQVEIRRRNFIPKDAFPYENAAGVVYDSGDYHKALDKLVDWVNIESIQDEIRRRRKVGEIVGLGLASCVEVSGGGVESGQVALTSEGKVVAITGVSPHGQGLATSFAQIISDKLGVDLDNIEIAHGDTGSGPWGRGTMGSRSLQLGGSAIQAASSEIRDKLLTEAAEMLEVSPTDLTFAEGHIRPVDSADIAISLEETVRSYIARQQAIGADGADPTDRIEVTARYEAEGETFPFGSTMVIVSIDRDTGRATIERFVAVDDVGNVINPLLVEGQLVGGAVQGIAEALWEQVLYDESGQLITGTLMDYAVPKASWLPNFELQRTTTPTSRNPLGAKGVGEAGTVHAPPAVANAIMDALRSFEVEQLDLPITDEKLWRIIHFSGLGIR